MRRFGNMEPPIIRTYGQVYTAWSTYTPSGQRLSLHTKQHLRMQYILGLDTSTTASKALLVDARGNVVGSASTPHDHSIPQPRWSEQNPLDWWRAIQESIRQVLRASGIDPASVKSIGLTGQMPRTGAVGRRRARFAAGYAVE